MKNKIYSLRNLLIFIGMLFLFFMGLRFYYYYYTSINNETLISNEVKDLKRILYTNEISKDKDIIFFESKSSTIGAAVIRKGILKKEIVLYSSGAPIDKNQPITYGFGEKLHSEKIDTIYFGLVNDNNIQSIIIFDRRAKITKFINDQRLWYYYTNQDFGETPLKIEGFSKLGDKVYENYSKSSKNKSYIKEQWYLQKFDFSMISQKFDFKNEVKIALCDSGVEMNHIDLEGIFLEGYDFIDNDTNPNDEIGHGTKMAGIIGAKKNNDIGIQGISQNIKIVPIKIIGKNKSTSELMKKGIEYALEKKVDIISFSVGTYEYSPELENAINKAIQKGITVIAATGNDGEGKLMYPARFENVIAVGSVGINNNVSHFSNYGKGIDIVAPGENIISTGPINEYYLADGTSAAASIVTGLVSLMLGIDNSLLPNQISKALRDSSSLNGEWNEKQGYGIINPQKTIERISLNSL